MPHICTRCSNTFESGEDILKGCPACGWKKFMFVRKMQQEPDLSGHSQERIITRAMGVRVPPRRLETESIAIEKTISLGQDPDPSPQISATPQAKVESSSQSGLFPGNEKALESIKITAPGTYELNLPSLFERDELIMAVKEGTYFIDLTSAFKKSKKD
jgi:predicted  nucleic acid-binding Zn-ribbon protein